MSSHPAIDGLRTDGGAASQPTPVLEEADRRLSRDLSLRNLRPPLKVPGYEQEQFLGQGSFGEVWKAVDSNSGRLVAIKFFSQRGGLDWSYMAREVEKLQYLFSDRHVVQLFKVGWEANPPYYVMEYIPSGSLEDKLQQGPLPVSEAVRLIRGISEGLVHAHDKGILHCDLKPANIMLDQDGVPRLADFGQARMRHEEAPSLGTLFYMAPEQADLKASPDARWDVYALGVILYRLITGRLPYLTEENAAVIASSGSIDDRLRSYKELLQASPRPSEHAGYPDVDKTLAEIINRCLAIDPKDRYPNVQSVLHSLSIREVQRAQFPLFVLGLVGPILVALVLGLAGTILFTKAISTAQRHLLERAAESNEFAAKSVAARFSLEVDMRWRILEQETAGERLQHWLTANSSLAGDRDESQRDLQQWLEARHQFWNRRFSRETRASYWFVLDRKGYLRAISPPDDSLVGRYFGFREYFHGQGHELSRESPVPAPITGPHRSTVFRSQPTNRPAVAFSVPIVKSDEAQHEVGGILVMESELGEFAEFHGSRNQFAVLVDLLPDETGKRGLVVEHPHLRAQLKEGRTLAPDYLDSGSLARIDRIREHNAPIVATREHVTSSVDSSTSPSLPAETSMLEAYVDPCGGEFSGEWLASAEPVFVVRGADAVHDSGWAVIVQERRTETLQPLKRDSLTAFYVGLGALLLVVMIMAGLRWSLVFMPKLRKRLRFLRRLGLAGTSMSSLSTTSASATSRRSAAEARSRSEQGAPPAVGASPPSPPAAPDRSSDDPAPQRPDATS